MTLKEKCQKSENHGGARGFWTRCANWGQKKVSGALDTNKFGRRKGEGGKKGGRVWVKQGKNRCKVTSRHRKETGVHSKGWGPGIQRGKRKRQKKHPKTQVGQRKGNEGSTRGKRVSVGQKRGNEGGGTQGVQFEQGLLSQRTNPPRFGKKLGGGHLKTAVGTAGVGRPKQTSFHRVGTGTERRDVLRRLCRTGPTKH